MTGVTSSNFQLLQIESWALQCQIISSCKRAWIKNFAVIPYKINHDHTIGQNRISVHIDIPSPLTHCLFGNSDVIKSILWILQIFGTLPPFYAVGRNLYQRHVRWLQLHIDRHVASLLRGRLYSFNLSSLYFREKKKRRWNKRETNHINIYMITKEKRVNGGKTYPTVDRIYTRETVMVILSTDAIAMKLSTQIRTWKTKPNSHQLNKYIN